MAEQLGERSDTSKEMVRKLRKLNAETRALTVNVLEDLGEQ